MRERMCVASPRELTVEEEKEWENESGRAREISSERTMRADDERARASERYINIYAHAYTYTQKNKEEKITER